MRWREQSAARTMAAANNKQQQKQSNSNTDKATATAGDKTAGFAWAKQDTNNNNLCLRSKTKRKTKKKRMQQKETKAETNKRQKHARKSREIYWQFSNKCTAQRMSYEMYICITVFVSVSASVAEQLRSCCHAAATKSCFAYFMVLDVLLQLPELQH